MSLGYFIDIQGTILSDVDKSPTIGSIESINYLNKKNIPYVFITNNTKKTPKEMKDFLKKQGFNFKEEFYIDPFVVLGSIVKEKEIYAFGPSSFKDVLSSMGYVQNAKKPKVILIASSDNFTFDDFAQMIELVLHGAKLIGMHGTSIYAKNNKRYPGVGAICEMIKYATKSSYEIVGKPSEVFFKEAFAILQKQNPNLSFLETEMISDDAVGDLMGAKKLGIKTSLVLSGKIKNKDEIKNIKNSIDKIYENIGQVFKERK